MTTTSRKTVGKSKAPQRAEVGANRFFQDIGEVRDFLSWCRSQKVQGVEIDGIKVAFSPLAFDRAPPSSSDDAEKAPPAIDPGTGYTEDELYP